MPFLAAHTYPIVSITHALLNRLVVIQLSTQLVEIGDLQIRSQPDTALCGGKLSQQHTEQGGLARSIGAHDSDLVAPHDGG